MYNSNVQLKGMEELKFYHSILSWYGLVTLFTLYLYGEKTKKKLNDTHRFYSHGLLILSIKHAYYTCVNSTKIYLTHLYYHIHISDTGLSISPLCGIFLTSHFGPKYTSGTWWRTTATIWPRCTCRPNTPIHWERTREFVTEPRLETQGTWLIIRLKFEHTRQSRSNCYDVIFFVNLQNKLADHPH